MQRVGVTLTNRLAYVTDADYDAFEALRDFWSFHPPGYYHMPGYKLWLEAKRRRDRRSIQGLPPDEEELPGWDGRIRMLRRGRLSAGLFRATWKQAEAALGIVFDVEYHRPEVEESLPGIPSAKDPKYHFQELCVERMLRAIRRGGGMVLAATATGKTATAARFFSRVPYQCLFVVDQLDLLYQTQKELAYWLKEPVGVVGDQKFQTERVTVATVQTLQLHLADPVFRRWYKKVKIEVVDELHEQLNKRNFAVLKEIQPLAIFGLTATLQLRKKEIRMEAYSFAGPVLFAFPYEEAVEAGVVTGGRVLQLLYPRVEEGDDYDVEVAENELKINAAAKIVHWLATEGRYVIVLVERVQHLEAVSNALGTLPHRLAYGKIKVRDRAQAKEQFEDGDIRVIVTNKVFKKGVNIKRVDAMLDLAEMFSPNDAMQKFGRGVRIHEDKDELLYLDFGTEKGRIYRRANSRRRAYRAHRIEVERERVTSAGEALGKVRTWLTKTPKPRQLGLALA
jgi:superfamily II DNA or RNA helicase